MHAIVKRAKGNGLVEIRNIPIPKIAASEILIKVYYTGICGTDIHIYKDEFPYYPPVVLGHEFSGEVVKVGKDVSRWVKGDRVVSEPQNGVCGVCRFCRTGNPEACENKRSPGWGVNGSFAEYIKLPDWLIHRIPDEVTYKEAALTEPAATAAQVMYNNAQVDPGDFVVVLGPGPIGLIVAQLAKIAGACHVVITGTKEDVKFRLPLAEKLGIDTIVNIDQDNPVEIVNKLTEGIGADVVIEATGAEPAINQAFDMIRKKGKIGVIGLPDQEKLNIKWLTAVSKALDIKFSFSSQYEDWKRILKLLKKKKLNLKELITHEFTLGRWQEAFHKVINGEAIKVLLRPGI